MLIIFTCKHQLDMIESSKYCKCYFCLLLYSLNGKMKSVTCKAAGLYVLFRNTRTSLLNIVALQYYQ